MYIKMMEQINASELTRHSSGVVLADLCNLPECSPNQWQHSSRQRQKLFSRLPPVLLSALLISIGSAEFAHGQTVSIVAEQAAMADAFVDSIGTMADVDYLDPAFFKQTIIPAIEYAGIRHFRYGAYPAASQYTTNISNLISQAYKDTGVRIGLDVGPMVWDCSNFFGDLSISGTLSWLPAGNIDSFEGLNEWNGNYCRNSAPWYTQDVSMQTALWNAVKGNAATANIPVFGPSLYFPDDPAVTLALAEQLGNLTAYMNYGNHHEYPGQFYPSANIGYDNSALGPMNGSLQDFASETGYETDLYNGGISEHCESQYFSRLYFEYFNAGMFRTYSYELIDQPSKGNYDMSNGGDPMGGPEANFGLLHSDGSYKQAFVTIANEIAILKDPGAAFTPGRLTYTLNNAPSQIHHTLLQKRNGTFYLVLWQEVNSWNSAYGGYEVAVSAQWVNVSFAKTFSQVNQYAPTGPVPHPFWSTPQVSSIWVPVQDQALILELIP